MNASPCHNCMKAGCLTCNNYGFPRYAFYPDVKKEERRYGPLTEDDVRRIVREELAAKKEGRDA
jgi:hypothetical protein